MKEARSLASDMATASGLNEQEVTPILELDCSELKIREMEKESCALSSLLNYLRKSLGKTTCRMLIKFKY